MTRAPGSAEEAGRNEALVRLLADQGWLTDSRVAEALRAVPRADFAPDRAWAVPDSDARPARPVDRSVRPDEWWEAVGSDTSLVTQVDDGAGDLSSGEGIFSSSLSSPSVVALFLELLSPSPGDRVLEVGTGSGWTAALLAHLVGERGRVVSAEIDPAIADRARGNCVKAGAQVEILAGRWGGRLDGERYDRLHVACGVRRVPWEWVGPLRVGGVGVLPWCPAYGAGSKFRFTRLDDRVVGRFHGPAQYMLNRDDRSDRGPLREWCHHWDERDVSRTEVDPRSLVWSGNPESWTSYGENIVVNALAPGVLRDLCEAEDGSGEATLWLRESFRGAKEHGSWAVVEYVPGSSDYEVAQYGPRRLWDEVRDAHLRWAALGRPDRDRFGLTVTADAEHVWLDTPDRVL